MYHYDHLCQNPISSNVAWSVSHEGSSEYQHLLTEK
jgi:hypothetical protein